jgi:hypothetical protein
MCGLNDNANDKLKKRAAKDHKKRYSAEATAGAAIVRANIGRGENKEVPRE